MRMIGVVAAVFLGGCQLVIGPGSDPAPRTAIAAPDRVAATRAPAAFAAVVRRVEPVAEAVCRERQPRANCDFRIVVDDRPGQPSNAFQTLDERGRPLIVFTLALINDARNADELAFVLGHEAAHHIRGHIPRVQRSAHEGALIGGLLATLGGFESGTVETAARIGATVGSRRYSKDFELQADALGTRIAALAGYDPVRGAEFFNRIPDPGDRFLGTHPPNADRIETVRRTASRL